MTSIRSIFHSAILLSASAIMAASQSPSSSNGSSHSADAPLTLEAAESQSNVILLGTVTNLGHSDFRGKGVIVYDSATITVLTTYLGAATSPFKLHIRLTRLNKAPVQGSQCLFFIREKEQHNYVIEFLPATNDNIAQVKALIATEPVTK